MFTVRMPRQRNLDGLPKVFVTFDRKVWKTTIVLPGRPHRQLLVTLDEMAEMLRSNREVAERCGGGRV